MARQIVRVQSKNGTLYIHLPKELAKMWNLNKGDYVELVFDDNKAIMRKI
jgi:antitoxin component of MazEF toxin-antitoxin module